ncbi:hypothetical protein ACH4E8_34215 [Streptomyces sp. NPDC017979]|uniref:hypothetical protein n=1 Tax=Streptomyces sp. NPDC017979 TaxID=3365024 RepID=UPI0037A5A14E
MEAAGGREWAVVEARERARTALSEQRQTSATPSAVAELEELTAFLVSRNL